jgi:hypothetical protein
MRTIEDILADLRAVIDGAAGRSLTDDEVTAYEGFEAELAAANRDREIRARQAAYETPVTDALHVDAADGQHGQPAGNPLAFTQAGLDELQAAISQRRGHSVDHRLDVRNATLETDTYGSRRVWGSNVLNGPRILHQVAGVPQQPADAIFAEFPTLTLPDAAAAADEGVTLSEYASSTKGSVTLGRFGRWTDLSGESLIGADAGALIGVHGIAVAKDLDDVLITAVETAAGSPVAFTSDVPAAIRKALATVVDDTAAETLDGVVIVTHPDDVALLENVTPTGGNSIGEPFQRFSGALVYPSSAVETGFMTVANLRAGVRYFEAEPFRSMTDIASVKTGVVTLASHVIAGYALGLVGFAVQVDVVTG